MLYSDGARARRGDSVRIGGRQYAQIVAIIDDDDLSNDDFYEGFDRWRGLDSGVLLWFPAEPEAMVAGDHGRVEYRQDLLGEPTITRVLKGPKVIDTLPTMVGPRDEMARYQVEFTGLMSLESRSVFVVTNGGDYKAMALAAIALGRIELKGPVTITDVERTSTAQPGDVVDRFSAKTRKRVPKTEVIGQPGEWGSPFGPVPRYTFRIGVVGEADVRVVRVMVSQGAGQAAVLAAMRVVFGKGRRLTGVLIESIELFRVEWQYKCDGDELRTYFDNA